MQAGDTLANGLFRLIELVGKGGMGQVWKAQETRSGRNVALKILHPWLAQDEDYVARFEREVEVSRRIVSPNVVRVEGFGRSEGTPFIVMELVLGESLRERLRRDGPMTWTDTLPIVKDMLTGLQAAHAVNVLHRDIKPGNIMVNSEGAKLADFGIAKATDLTGLTGSSTMLGTPAYMAPDDEESVQSDLYAVGCVVFEMLTGAPPFEGSSMQSVLMKHTKTPIDLARVPPRARSFISVLAEKDRTRRPVSAAAVLALLPGKEPATPNPSLVAKPARAPVYWGSMETTPASRDATVENFPRPSRLDEVSSPMYVHWNHLQ